MRIVMVIDVPMHHKKHCLSVLILIGSQFITTVTHFIGLIWLYLLLKSYFSHWKNNEKKTCCWYLKTIRHINTEQRVINTGTWNKVLCVCVIFWFEIESVPAQWSAGGGECVPKPTFFLAQQPSTRQFRNREGRSCRLQGTGPHSPTSGIPAGRPSQDQDFISLLRYILACFLFVPKWS